MAADALESKIMSRRDISFMLYEWLDVESLITRPRFQEHSREVFDAVLDLAEKISVNDFAPHNRSADENEPRFDGERVHVIPEVGAALKAFNKSGLFGAAMDYEVGGGQIPNVIHRACFTWLQAANVATSGYPMLTMASANLLCAHGTAEQVSRFVLPMLDGSFFGTMCMSEPQAGSSLADVTTVAISNGEGSFRLFGSKMWISGGDHDLSQNIVHLVLARTQDAPRGVKGLSLFIVPKFLVESDGTQGQRNDVVLAGINHKMGFRGTVNTVLNFGEGAFTPDGEAGAIGYLVGTENEGLTYMFHMMNEARLVVGAGAVALGYTSYLHALDYARGRLQGRLPGGNGPLDAQVPIVMHADVRRMLLASKSYVEGGLALVLFSAKLLDEQETANLEADRLRAELLLDVLTPIVKAWPSKWCLTANHHAIQIHGGYGYSRDYPVEQFYRDNRLNSIHEGTDGIQALDLLGRKVIEKSGSGLRILAESIKETVRRSPIELYDYATRLHEYIERIQFVTESLWEGGDSRRALANATIYADCLGHVVIAWMWLEQCIVASGKEGPFYDGKRAAAHYFYAYELPTIEPQLNLLEVGDNLLLELDVVAL